MIVELMTVIRELINEQEEELKNLSVQQEDLEKKASKITARLRLLMTIDVEQRPDGFNDHLIAPLDNKLRILQARTRDVTLRKKTLIVLLETQARLKATLKTP